MTSKRKLEEEIARTKDPVVRKQLQELLDKREQRRDKTIENAKEIGASLLGEITEEVEPFFSRVAAILWIGIAILLIIFFLEWVFGT
jgi:predicted Holliday junction resolvase-like endonuclease